MIPQEAANAMTGRQYLEEEPRKGFFAEAAKSGLVIIYGASDDLMEIEGAVRDEVGAPGTVHFTKAGLLENPCEDDDCPYFAKEKEKAAAVHAKQNELGWVYETDIPHFKFIIMEDGEQYGEGIVFDLRDVP